MAAAQPRGASHLLHADDRRSWLVPLRRRRACSVQNAASLPKRRTSAPIAGPALTSSGPMTGAADVRDGRVAPAARPAPRTTGSRGKKSRTASHGRPHKLVRSGRAANAPSPSPLAQRSVWPLPRDHLDGLRHGGGDRRHRSVRAYAHAIRRFRRCPGRRPDRRPDRRRRLGFLLSPGRARQRPLRPGRTSVREEAADCRRPVLRRRRQGLPGGLEARATIPAWGRTTPRRSFTRETLRAH